MLDGWQRLSTSSRWSSAASSVLRWASDEQRAFLPYTGGIGLWPRLPRMHLCLLSRCGKICKSGPLGIHHSLPLLLANWIAIRGTFLVGVSLLFSGLRWWMAKSRGKSPMRFFFLKMRSVKWVSGSQIFHESTLTALWLASWIRSRGSFSGLELV